MRASALRDMPSFYERTGSSSGPRTSSLPAGCLSGWPQHTCPVPAPLERATKTGRESLVCILTETQWTPQKKYAEFLRTHRKLPRPRTSSLPAGCLSGWYATAHMAGRASSRALRFASRMMCTYIRSVLYGTLLELCALISEVYLMGRF